MAVKEKKLLVRDFGELPEKIQGHLRGEIADGFLGGLKTSYKPNPTIPILWLIVYREGVLFCSTHKSRGIFKTFSITDIDSIKFHKGSGFSATKVEIIVSDINSGNFVFTLPTEQSFNECMKLFESVKYQIL